MSKNAMMMGQGYEALGNAVVMQAVEDWRLAAKKLRTRPSDMAARIMLCEAEEFFRSHWFNRFSNLDGMVLLSQLRHEAGMEVVA